MDIESFNSVEHGIIRQDGYDKLYYADGFDIGPCVAGDRWTINQRELYPMACGHVTRITTYCWRSEDILGWFKAAPGVVLMLVYDCGSYYMQLADSNSRQLITLMLCEAHILGEEMISDAFLYLADHIMRGAVASIGTITL